MVDFYIKQGDTLPTLDATLTQANKQPISLAGVTQVLFKMRNSAGTTVINSPAIITNASKGKVSYAWQASDTLLAGNYEAEFEVYFDGGTIETIPNNDYIEVCIFPVLPELPD